MQRLLMGEVGSGKTVVALLRDAARGRARPPGGADGADRDARRAALRDDPAAARRRAGDARAADRLDAGGAARELLARLGSGELSLVVGTHALIEPDVRFAVAGGRGRRRAAPLRRAPAHGAAASARRRRPPHVLHMTATPIPRTLALARYGDLDQTRLRERPRGRQPVRTTLVCGERERARAYERAPRGAARRAPGLRRLPAGRGGGAGAGRAAAAGRGGARAARASSSAARGRARDFRLVLLHGQHAPAREAGGDGGVRRRRGADVLVATTVIEVGIDVPERDGDADRERRALRHLAAAPAARPRRPRRAPLAVPAVPASARRSPRLRALAEHDDGFELAEIDLRLRSEGELVGTRQSGLGRFRFARLPDDEALLELATRTRRALIAADPELSAPEHALLGADWRPSAPSWTAPLGGVDGRLDRPVRVIAGSLGGRRLRAPRGSDHAADRRARARGAVLDARNRRRGARARPLRRHRRARDRGALARRRERHVRRARRARARGAARQPVALGLGEDRAEVRARGGAGGARGGHASAKRHTIWCSSTLPTRWPGELREALSARSCPRCSPPARASSIETDRRAPLELGLELARESDATATLASQSIATHEQLRPAPSPSVPGSYDPITNGHVDVIRARREPLRRGRRRRRRPLRAQERGAVRDRRAGRASSRRAWPTWRASASSRSRRSSSTSPAASARARSSRDCARSPTSSTSSR